MNIRSRLGITLVELIVVLGATSILLLASMSAMNQFVRIKAQSQMFNDVVSMQIDIKTMLRDSVSCTSILTNATTDASRTVSLRPENFSSAAILARYPSLAQVGSNSSSGLVLTSALIRRPVGFDAIGILDLSFTKGQSTLKRSIPLILTETTGVVSACEAYTPQTSADQCPAVTVRQGRAMTFDCQREGEDLSWRVRAKTVTDPTIETEIDDVVARLANAIDRRKLDFEAGNYRSATSIRPGADRRIQANDVHLNVASVPRPLRNKLEFYTTIADVDLRNMDGTSVYTTGKAEIGGGDGSGLVVANEVFGDYGDKTVMAKRILSNQIWGGDWHRKDTCLIAEVIDDLIVADESNNSVIFADYTPRIKAQSDDEAKAYIFIDQVDLIEDAARLIILTKTVKDVLGSLPDHISATQSIGRIVPNERDHSHRIDIRAPTIGSIDLREMRRSDRMAILADRIGLLQLEFSREDSEVYLGAASGGNIVIDVLEVELAIRDWRDNNDRPIWSDRAVQVNKATFENQTALDKFKLLVPGAVFVDVTLLN